VRLAILSAVAVLGVSAGARGDDADPAAAARPAPPAPSPGRPLIDGPGVLALGGATPFVDTDVEHATNSDAVALRLGGRLVIGDRGFLEGEAPIGWQRQANAATLGNVTFRAGVLRLGPRLAALWVRGSAPTAPEVGTGQTVAAALAAPRVADPELFLPHTSSFEGLADWRWQREASWLQLETGIAGRWRPQTNGEAVLRASVAGGVRVASWLDLAASFVTRSFVLVRDAKEDYVHALIFAIVVHRRCQQLAVRLEVPIDTSARDAERFLVGVELR
jgi:hypothetical protein